MNNQDDESLTMPLPRWFMPEVSKLIERAVAELSETKGPMTSYSANEVARLARRRRSDVAEAISSGALKHTKRGARFVIAGSSLDAWIEAGCPTRI